MGKFKYSSEEHMINNVLTYQSKELKEIEFPDVKDIDNTIDESIELLKQLGYDSTVTKTTELKVHEEKLIQLPDWEELCAVAEKEVGSNCQLDALFTPEELLANEEYIKSLNDEYNAIHKLDKTDIAICVSAGLLSAIVDILLVGIPKPTKEGLSAGKLSDWIREEFEKKYPQEEMEKLANSKESKVPFDAQDNRNTEKHVEGLSTYYHRLLSLGHDPVLGFVVGVMDIKDGKMTTIDKLGNLDSQPMKVYADRKETELFAALAKQIVHFKSDITTPMGLPAPFMALFNFLQFGKIGDAEQTIAEIVQGMYYEGYDFIHFCSMSVPVTISEVVVRMGYAIKRINEGYSIKDSIPVSLSREKHPKLSTMLFSSHTIATAANLGKICFSKNPTAINYPQWIAFIKYSYKQLKWSLMNKPILRDKYTMNMIDEELYSIIDSIDDTYNNIVLG